MRIAMPVEGEQVGHGWGRARVVAIVDISDGKVSGWQEDPVGWDTLHNSGTEGAHHARIVRWCRDNEITDVLVHHMGQGMVTTLTKLGLNLHQTNLPGARESVDALVEASTE